MSSLEFRIIELFRGFWIMDIFWTRCLCKPTASWFCIHIKQSPQIFWGLIRFHINAMLMKAIRPLGGTSLGMCPGRLIYVQIDAWLDCTICNVLDPCEQFKGLVLLIAPWLHLEVPGSPARSHSMAACGVWWVGPPMVQYYLQLYLGHVPLSCHSLDIHLSWLSEASRFSDLHGSLLGEDRATNRRLRVVVRLSQRTARGAFFKAMG